MFRVTVKCNGEESVCEYSAPVLAADVLSDAKIMIKKPCGGKGICGKCKIKLNGKEVLACRTYVEKDSLIEYTHQNQSVNGITDGFTAEFKKDPIIDCGYGAAIDIGTTTVAGYIYKFPECILVKSLCLPNPQAQFGADVISRIEYCKNGGGETLKKSIADTICELTKGFEIERYVICGNTAMIYLLTGTDPDELGRAPYSARYTFGKWYDNAYIVHCPSAFVGGDITSAVLSSGLIESNTALLVDIGTNGEMVLKHNDKLCYCSTAAGPCFEGAGIDCGMTASDGAINRVNAGKELVYETIGNVAPTGVCGTGLIDSVAALLRMGIIDSDGYMKDNVHFGKSGIYISPRDVRNFQLAKSAIRTGIDTLINHVGIRYEDIDVLYIAGGFGNFLRIESAVKTGLIPSKLAGKAKAIGNAAGMGAAMMLQSKEKLCLSEKLLDGAQAVTLYDNEYFLEKYIDNMGF